MLAGLDAVPWAKLDHALGRATDLPALLGRLATVEGAAWDEALADLAARIAHQGTRYPASVATVPFVLELMATTAGDQRMGLVRLLTALAVTDPDECLIDGVTGEALGGSTGKRCNEAIAAGVDAIAPALRDDRTDVRAATARLLGLLPKAARASLAHLRGRVIDEPDEAVRATVILAFGLCTSAARSRGEAEGLRPMLDDGAPEVRAATAIALGRLDRKDEHVRAGLHETASTPALAHTAVDWNGGDLAGSARALLEARGDLTLAQVLEELPAELAAGARPERRARIEQALRVALPSFFRHQILLPEELSAAQRHLLTLLVDDERACMDAVFHLRLEAYDNHQVTLRRFLGLDPPTPLERRLVVKVGDAARSWPVWRIFLGLRRGEVERAAVVDTLAALDPEAAVGVAIDVAGLPANHGLDHVPDLVELLVEAVTRHGAAARPWLERAAPAVAATPGVLAATLVAVALTRSRPADAAVAPAMVPLLRAALAQYAGRSWHAGETLAPLTAEQRATLAAPTT